MKLRKTKFYFEQPALILTCIITSYLYSCFRTSVLYEIRTKKKKKSKLLEFNTKSNLTMVKYFPKRLFTYK